MQVAEQKIASPLVAGQPASPVIYSYGGAGEGNRTLIASLEGWCFTTKLHPHLAMFLARRIPLVKRG